MARPTRRAGSPSDTREGSGAKRPRVTRRRAPPAPVGGGEPAIPNDLVDVEAPPAGGDVVDTAAYAAPAETSGSGAIANDLVDVEAPPAGGAAVDTAAYAAPRKARGGKRKPSLVEAQSLHPRPRRTFWNAPAVRPCASPPAGPGRR